VIPGHFYMHKNALDVAIKVYDTFLIAEEGLMYVESTWYNLGALDEPFEVNGDVSRFPIETSKLGDWVDITDKINHRRNKPGLPE